MGRPGLDSCQYLVDYTGIPMSAEEVMKAMEKRQEELFQKVSPMPGALKCEDMLLESLPLVTGQLNLMLHAPSYIG